MVVMFEIELVEGKDRPSHIWRKEFHEEVGTSLLLSRITKSLFVTGNIVILDRGLCVLKAIVYLKKRAVYASALIKKRRYFPNILMWPAFRPS